ncbi:MAG TPA: hypothetical protein PKA38_01285 [Candidatus Levybacteria bacterium]|nr:hypothetical protein [Candidatus Levybacteria bacterium]
MARLIEGQPMKGRVVGEPKGISQRASLKRSEENQQGSLCTPIFPDQTVARRQWPRPSKTK